MASFSFQHHPILLDSAPMAITSSGLSSNQHITNQEIAFSHFHYPTAILSDELTHHGMSFHESMTKKQSSDESTVVDKLESSGDEQVTQKLPLPVEKKRKGRNGISSNSSESKAARGKKQKSGKNTGSIVKVDHDVDNNNKVKLGQEEPPSGFIHVRARRGQATDSHSLAERVRREKINERMKMLQRLVPGCDKVTGKALMLDEIINYVQSLQNQVEFLSMKLASLNPMFYDFGMDIDSFLMRPEGLQISSVAQDSNTNSYTTLMDNNSASMLMQQGHIRPNAFSLESVSLLWDLENERQSFENASGFTNLCSFH